MFNLIMRSFDVGSTTGRMPLERMFEYTDDGIADRFSDGGAPAVDRLQTLPCLFMDEGLGDELAYVGNISAVRTNGREVQFNMALDRGLLPIENRTIYEHRNRLGMPHDFEFSRNHWAVKNADLFRFLLDVSRPRRQLPKVFTIPEIESINPTLVSAMMPFDAAFGPVYRSIQAAAGALGMTCTRADNIWENAVIIQDVVSLIDRSRIVVCDCTNKNANVFYEAGIAHTLGREVILITQSKYDIPFDLQHLRYIHYLNNAEGLEVLTGTLVDRIKTVTA